MATLQDLIINFKTLYTDSGLIQPDLNTLLLHKISQNSGGGGGGGSSGTQYLEGLSEAPATGTVLLFRRADGTLKAVQGDNSDRIKTIADISNLFALDTTAVAIRDQLPTALGATTAANSFPVTLATDGAFAIAFGNAADASASTDTANTGFISLFKRLFSKLPSALVGGRLAVDSIVKTAASNPLQYNAVGTSAGTFIKNTAGTLYSLSCINSNTSIRYLQLFNKSTAPANADVPVESFVVYGGGGQLILGQDYFSLNGLDFATGISWGISTTGTTYTAATAAETIFTARYL